MLKNYINSRFVCNLYPNEGVIFNYDGMHKIYDDVACKLVFPTFESWLDNMLKNHYYDEISTGRVMNTLELTQYLYELAQNQSKYAMNYCTAIINAIIVQYITKTEYMEENAIATFRGFLDKGVLTW